MLSIMLLCSYETCSHLVNVEIIHNAMLKGHLLELLEEHELPKRYFTNYIRYRVELVFKSEFKSHRQKRIQSM